ncbi:hypothetical protein HDU98_008369 [Podochytrium sp. JEL0797]|nr:hypothetical protein HDU98_008369 [Podochytrium sp. JEL0797]
MSSNVGVSGAPRNGAPSTYRGRGGRGGGGGYRGNSNASNGVGSSGGGGGAGRGSAGGVAGDSQGKGKWGNGPPAFKTGDSRPPSAMSHTSNASQPLSQPAASAPQNEQMDRIYFILMHMVGTKVLITLKGNVQFEGILHTATASTDLGVCLGMAHQIVNGKRDPHVIASLVVLPEDLVALSAVDLEIAEGKAESGNSGGFQTDSAIGSRVGEFGRERELVAWSSDEVDNTLSLDDRGSGLTGEKWDQFATNESLFGVETDFKEEIYTTVIDKSDPNFKRKEAEAVRLAREIETGFASTDNTHLLEERNLITPNDDGDNEEDKYSSVLRKSENPENVYIPPAARAAASRTAVPSAPVAAAAVPKKAEIAVSTTSAAVKTNTDANQTLQTAPPTTKSMAIPEPGARIQRSKSPVPASTTIVSAAATMAQKSQSSRPSPAATAGKFESTSDAAKVEPKTSAVASKIGTERRDELLNKLPVKTGSPSGSPQLARADPVTDSFQKFQMFADRERSRMKSTKKPLRESLTKPKPEVLNELRAFSSSFKLPMPFPSELKDIIKGESSSGSPASKAASLARTPKAGEEGSAPSAVATTPATTTTTTAAAAPVPPAATGEKSKFKFNLGAAEFTPSFVMAPDSPPHEKGGKPQRNNSGGFNKGYKAAYGYQQNYRPQFNGQPYDDGSYPQPPMDPNQPFYYQVPAGFPGHYQPMMPRPGFVPGGMPQMMGPGGVPYMMPYQMQPGAMVPQMMPGGVPPMGVPMYAPRPGGAPPPPPPNAPPRNNKNGPPTPTSGPAQPQGSPPTATSGPQMIAFRPPAPTGGEGFAAGSPQNYMSPPPNMDPAMYHQMMAAAAAAQGVYPGQMPPPPQGFYPHHHPAHHQGMNMMVPMMWPGGDPMQMAEMQQHMIHQQMPMHMQQQQHLHHQQQQQHHQQRQHEEMQGEQEEEEEEGEEDVQENEDEDGDETVGGEEDV